MMNSGSPYSTGWPFSTRMALITPPLSDSISFSNFIASMMMNERKAPVYKWNVKGKLADFKVDSIRRKGTR